MSLKQLLDLTGRKAIITGGSRGLGLEIAEVLGELGAEVLVSARKQDGLDEALAHLRAQGVKASALTCDMADLASVQQFAAAALARLGHCDILVNNAGATWGSPAEDFPMNAWLKVMNVNLNGVFLLSQHMAKQSMIPRHYGRIVNIASTSGLRGPFPDTLDVAAYSASKGGMVNLTRHLASEWGEFGITVNAIAPGTFESKMSKPAIEALKASAKKMVPTRGIAAEEDFKGVAALLCSDACRFITGQILSVDGGSSAVG
ncbi:MAG: SDR family oxidoreductase [Burkholderiales bacterium]